MPLLHYRLEFLLFAKPVEQNTLFVVMVPQVHDLINDVRELSLLALICLHIEPRAKLVSIQQQVKMTS